MSSRLPVLSHTVVTVGGVPVAYREAGRRTGAPTVLLLHGFPSGAHQFRRLIDVLGPEHHVLAPDYPGFGATGTDFSFAANAPWTFDWLADVVEGFLDSLRIERVVAYVFDWGGPILLRIAERRPDLIRGLVIQNANIYDEGLSDAARAFIALDETDSGAVESVLDLLHEHSTRSQYLSGARRPEAVAPESWLLDQAYLDRGERTGIQVRLAFDYKSNLRRYSGWQAWLRHHQPPTLVVWGRHDPFFTVDGALAYLRDVPHADVHLLDTGHFALEERVDTVASLMLAFLDRLEPDSGRVRPAATPPLP